MSHDSQRDRLSGLLMAIANRKMGVEQRRATTFIRDATDAVDGDRRRFQVSAAMEVLALALAEWIESELAQFDRTGYSPYLHVNVLAA